MSEFDIDPAMVADVESAFRLDYEQSQLDATGRVDITSLLPDSYLEIDYVLTEARPKDNQRTICVVAQGPTQKMVDSSHRFPGVVSLALGSWVEIAANEFTLTRLPMPGVIRPGLGLTIGADPSISNQVKFLPSIITGMRFNGTALFDPTHHSVSRRFKQDYVNRAASRTGRLGILRLL